MSRELDLFEGVESAWSEFRRELADRIAQHDELDHILLEVDVPERHDAPCGPYIQVNWTEGDDTLLAEVSSNRIVDPKFRIRKAERQLLREAGWQRPDDEQANYWFLFDAAYADQVASMLVEALREVFGVIHPAFLVDRFAEDCEAMAASEETTDDVVEPTAVLPDVVSPTNHEHLVEIVDTALGSDWGRAMPVHDDDGDIPYLGGSAVVFVRVLEETPAIRIFSELVVNATDLEAAAFEVNVLNRDHSGVKFVLIGDLVRMSIDLPALPLVPYHLRSMVTMMCDLAPRLDGDLAHRISGRPFLMQSEDEAA